MDPLELTLLEAAAALRTRQLGHLEYVQALLAQTDRLTSLNAWISRGPEGLVLQAKAFDQASSAPSEHLPLAGIPVAIKDNIDTANLPTSGGTRALLASRPQRNAAVVERLLQSGGLIAGKTNLHELALGGTTNNAVTGACRNPWNPLRIPGGSSGGSAVAVAARMVPAALERAAKTFDTKFVYCAPSLHNPPSATMPQDRREAIAQVARSCGLYIIEDCVHAAMQAHPLPALSTWLPEQSFLLSSFSKVLAPGLRVGYVEAAPQWLSKFAASMRADSWMVAPLLPEIATRWLESGAMERLIAQQRAMTAERLLSAHRLLAGLDYKSDIEYPLIWLPLPEPWRAGQFAAALRQAGVLVRTADHFAVGRSPAPHAIRISLNSAASVAQLEEGLVILRALLDSPPSMAMDP